MNATETIVGIDTERPQDEPMAAELLRYLVDAYPGYGWFVLIRQGIIKICIPEWSDAWGMILHYSAISSDAGDRKKKTVRMAGEFLERARMKRGTHDGTPIKAIEGVPMKYIARAAFGAA